MNEKTDAGDDLTGIVAPDDSPCAHELRLDRSVTTSEHCEATDRDGENAD
jgi:hypothetical protein